MVIKSIIDGFIEGSISWVAPTTRTDGSLYDGSQHQGYTLGVDTGDGLQEFVSIPAAYDITEWPLNDLMLPGEGTYNLALATVDNNDLTSDWSNVIELQVVAQYRPNAPTGFVIL